MAAQELPVKPPRDQKLKRTNQLKFLKKLLEEMIRKDSATEFFSVPYNENVKNPMDLKTVQLRLKNQFYVRGRNCIKDIHLIFSNACKFYYPDSIQVQNAKALEHFFYTKLENMPKPECELPAISDKDSKPIEVRKKEKKMSPARRKGDKKISYCTSKLKKVSKTTERKRDCQKKIPSQDKNLEIKKFQSTVQDITDDLSKLNRSQDKNLEIKKFQSTVQEITNDLSKLNRPINYVDNLKLYDSLLKVKLLYKKFQQYLAQQKNEGVTNIANTSLATSMIEKSKLDESLNPKETMEVLPSTSGGAGVELLLHSKSNTTLPDKVKSKKDKINDIKSDAKPNSNSILPSVNMVEPEIENPGIAEKPETKPIPNLNIAKSQNEKKSNKPSDLEILLQSERFRLPIIAGPTITAERNRQREIAQKKRENLGGKINLGLAAEICRAFEIEHGIYPYNGQKTH